MREIKMENSRYKFRAWDRSRKLMVSVWDIGFKAWRDSEINYINVHPCKDGGTYELLEGSFDLMQYTGLKDKNGVEIYEGDIVFIPIDGEWERVVVSWELDREVNGWNVAPYDIENGLEILGNTHENPELLEK